MITLKRPEEIAVMRQAGRYLGEVLAELRELVRPGITTLDLDRAADRAIRRRGCIPGFLGYEGFPRHLCISVNEEVVHGIPGRRRLQDGDLVSLDCGLVHQGWWADAGLSVGCGTLAPAAQRLLDVTNEALRRGVAQARPGNRIGDIGHAVQEYVEAQGFGVVRQYVGHGIGRDMHEEPQVPNYGRPGRGVEIRRGLCLAIEPMVNERSPETRVQPDGWTVVTADGGWACYAEHTVAITDEGPEILTLPPD